MSIHLREPLGSVFLFGLEPPHRLGMMTAMLFQIHTTRGFSAAHQLRLYDGSLEPVHGHNWKVQVTVESPQLDAIGVVMDFHVLERLLDAIIGPFHNHHLNEIAPFDKVNPTAENVARHVLKSLVLPPPVRVVAVEVWETAENSAVCLA
jgi:6-pyruvoyltetrahydropterin/6-carboxytetrahydropterin synthase